jgi:Transcriptional regulator
MRLRDINKEALVKEKACELLVSLGFEGFSMSKLAKACNISVGTLYIYYKDKEDLFQKLGVEFGQEYYDAMMENFSPEMSFEEGLWIQWKNRANFVLANSHKVAFHYIIQLSNHKEYVMAATHQTLTETLGRFIQNCIEKKEIKEMSHEVFWSIAYGPLNTLINFHNRGKGYGENGYKLNKKDMKESFDLVIKALQL